MDLTSINRLNSDRLMRYDRALIDQREANKDQFLKTLYTNARNTKREIQIHLNFHQLMEQILGQNLEKYLPHSILVW